MCILTTPTPIACPLWLSQKFFTLFWNLPNSPNKPFNQIASLQACEAYIYSTYVVDIETMFRSFEIQLIVAPARVNRYLEVDLLLSKSLANLNQHNRESHHSNHQRWCKNFLCLWDTEAQLESHFPDVSCKQVEQLFNLWEKQYEKSLIAPQTISLSWFEILSRSIFIL